MVKKIKKDNKIFEMKRHFGVLVEHMDSKFDLVIEGHRVFDKKIDDFREDVDNRFKEVDYKFGVVFEKLDGIDDELRLIRNELKEKVDREEFLALQKRFIKLEKFVHSAKR